MPMASDAPLERARPAPHLPHDIVKKVFEYAPPLDFLLVCAPSCKALSFEWYTSRAYTGVVIVPDAGLSINAAINTLGKLNKAATRKGLVLVRPGRYAESVRITQNCHVLGFGPGSDIVIEAPGWESALVSAGLGVRRAPRLTTGEDACVENLTFRCRNENMQGRCVSIVMGQLSMVRCTVYGGVVISGFLTAPLVRGCHIRQSRGNGVRLTDHCSALIKGNRVVQHGQHGIIIDRESSPVVESNKICSNAGSGIRIFNSSLENVTDRLRDNYIVDNGEDEVSMLPYPAELDDSDIEMSPEID